MGFKKINWSNRFRDVLAPALGLDLPVIESEIKTGVCDLYSLGVNGHLVTRRERINDCFVLVAGVGKNAHEVIQQFQVIAKLEGFKFLRIHSVRKGYERFIRPLGFEVIETRGHESVFLKRIK